ncbi:MAG: hypothetical protein JWQ96_2586 [Segetibacter sp.]|nr:hypothetical protein [Segetibacter sp.]
MKKSTILFSTICIVLISFGCGKLVYEVNSTFQVRLANGGEIVQQVNIDIEEVRIKTSKDTSWKVLPTKKALYNLANYGHGVDTAVASGPVAATSIVSEVRFVLGNRSTITIGEITYPLSLVANYEKNMTIKVGRKLNLSEEKVVISFDPRVSSSSDKNAGFVLNPVLKLQ